jgi:aspartate carbamoyltransferase catalytic subunit
MHSLIKGLSRYESRLFLVAPEELRTPAALRDLLHHRNISYIETPDLQSVLPELDVIYIVMLQHHRISEPDVVERLQRQYYRITPQLLTQAKPDVIILHPLVRRDEVSPDVDDLPNAVYFQQAANGVVVRMALLSQIFSRTL